jgi:hypothetical protein
MRLARDAEFVARLGHVLDAELLERAVVEREAQPIGVIVGFRPDRDAIALDRILLLAIAAPHDDGFHRPSCFFCRRVATNYLTCRHTAPRNAATSLPNRKPSKCVS